MVRATLFRRFGVHQDRLALAVDVIPLRKSFTSMACVPGSTGFMVLSPG
jgi:hypothetical protein